MCVCKYIFEPSSRLYIFGQLNKLVQLVQQYIYMHYYSSIVSIFINYAYGSGVSNKSMTRSEHVRQFCKHIKIQCSPLSYDALMHAQLGHFHTCTHTHKQLSAIHIHLLFTIHYTIHTYSFYIPI